MLKVLSQIYVIWSCTWVTNIILSSARRSSSLAVSNVALKFVKYISKNVSYILHLLPTRNSSTSNIESDDDAKPPLSWRQTNQSLFKARITHIKFSFDDRQINPWTQFRIPRDTGFIIIIIKILLLRAIQCHLNNFHS